jgi:hypothetical protein
MRIIALLTGAVLLSSMAAAPAEAYWYRTCNGIKLKLQSNNLAVFSSDTSFPAGYWRDGLQNSVNQFNAHPSNFWYTRFNHAGTVSRGNGRSEVWGSTDGSVLQCNPGCAPAIAYSFWQCYWTPWTGTVAHMTEGDVIFNYRNTATDPFEWTADRNKNSLIFYRGTRRMLQATAVHEFGHAAGLLHENRTYNVMGSDFTHVHTNGATTNAYVGEDSGNGLTFLYGLWLAGPLDLGAVHWRHLGASGEYSTHTRTQLFNTSGGVLPGVTVVGEPGHQVRRGQVVRAQFTFENNGRATVFNVPLRYYISTDDIITPFDRAIGFFTYSLARDWVSTVWVNLTIPSNLALNTNYYLGAYINPLNSPAEGYTYNNGTYIPIRVVP